MIGTLAVAASSMALFSYKQKQQQQLHQSALLLMRPKISQLKGMITHKDTLQLSSMSIMIPTSDLACFVNQALT